MQDHVVIGRPVAEDVRLLAWDEPAEGIEGAGQRHGVLEGIAGLRLLREPPHHGVGLDVETSLLAALKADGGVE